MSEAVVEIVGLSKRFGAGVLAVDDLSFTVERGQVCGLLGPNGAGKTTCLRMLLGLIRPTRGEACLFGERVTPGPAQLRRVGALIETAAFVPHLSGMQEPAALVGGRRRPVGRRRPRAGARDRRPRHRDRPQGQDVLAGDAPAARPRPGAARASPRSWCSTSPPTAWTPAEMREVRQLVRRVAEAGSTVLFSSHMLAEVEQICTHAVVMDKGSSSPRVRSTT